MVQFFSGKGYSLIHLIFERLSEAKPCSAVNYLSFLYDHIEKYIFIGTLASSRSLHRFDGRKDVDEAPGNHFWRNCWKTKQRRPSCSENGKCQPLPHVFGLQG